MYDRGKKHSSSNFSGYSPPPGYRSARMRRLQERKRQQKLEDGEVVQEIPQKELYWSVAFLPAIPVVAIGGYVLVAIGSTLLLQVKDKEGNSVTVAEYTSDNLTELLNLITDDINRYYQSEGKASIEEIREGVDRALRKITVTQEPGNQIYRTPSHEQQTVEHTGAKPPEVETETSGFDTEAGRETVEQQNHTGNTSQQDFDLGNYIFESRRRNVEGHDNEGGHTRDRHIGKAEQWLRDRQINQNLKGSSSFHSDAHANLTQARFVKQYRKEIREWLNDKDADLRFAEDITMDREIGTAKTRKGKLRSTNKAKVVLKKDNSELGYHVLTSYPIP